MPAPSNIKDYYKRKNFANVYFCHLEWWWNGLSEIWHLLDIPSIPSNTDIIIVPYDAIQFDRQYNHSLDEHLAYAKQSGMFVIIDKIAEHVWCEPSFMELHHNLQKHGLLERCVVFDSTKDETMFKKYNIAHVYGPYDAWFAIQTRLPKFNAQPSYTFLCLNNIDKAHRLATILRLHEQKLIQHTLWSYRSEIRNTKNIEKLIPNFNKDMINFTLPHFIDQPHGKFDQYFNVESLYQQSLCTIVTESDYFFPHTQFASEKSWLAVFFGTLPIIVGAQGTIDLMREHGIDVYDDIVDQSYDEIADPKQRFDRIFSCIEQCAGRRELDKIMSLIAPRMIRNQILLTHKDHWIKEISRPAENFFSKNKISI